jgi:hypothetical protein
MNGALDKGLPNDHQNEWVQKRSEEKKFLVEWLGMCLSPSSRFSRGLVGMEFFYDV